MRSFELLQQVALPRADGSDYQRVYSFSYILLQQSQLRRAPHRQPAGEHQLSRLPVEKAVAAVALLRQPARQARAAVEAVDRFPFVRGAHRQVDLRGLDRGVAHQLADAFDWDAAVGQRRAEAVAQHVRAHMTGAGAAGVAPECIPHRRRIRGPVDALQRQTAGLRHAQAAAGHDFDEGLIAQVLGYSAQGRELIHGECLR